MVVSARSSLCELRTINKKGVIQGCSLLPEVFNIYIDYIMRRWKQEIDPGLQLSQHTTTNTCLFVDGQLVVYDEAIKLQRDVNKLSCLCIRNNMEISTYKRIVIAFEEVGPIRSKIIINNRTCKSF